jgi:hypothetical protein
MTLSLRGNGIAGELTFDEAEAQCQWLVAMGRTMPPEDWVTALGERARMAANGQWLAGFMG